MGKTILGQFSKSPQPEEERGKLGPVLRGPHLGGEWKIQTWSLGVPS